MSDELMAVTVLNGEVTIGDRVAFTQSGSDRICIGKVTGFEYHNSYLGEGDVARMKVHVDLRTDWTGVGSVHIGKTMGVERFGRVVKLDG